MTGGWYLIALQCFLRRLNVFEQTEELDNLYTSEMFDQRVVELEKIAMTSACLNICALVKCSVVLMTPPSG